MTGRRVRIGASLVLFCLALGFRLVGIDHGLPHFSEPDTYLVDQADAMIEGGVGDRSRAGWKYPHLIGTVLALVPPESVERLGSDASLGAHLDVASRLRLRGRVLVAVLSSLAAPATFLIAARFLSVRFAFLAGFLVVTSLLHICFSAQARPHGPVSAFVMLAVLAAIRWRERPSVLRATACGLALAASVGTLHSGAAALLPAGAAFLGLLRTSAPRLKVVPGAFLGLMIVAAAIGWFYIADAAGAPGASASVRAEVQAGAPLPADADSPGQPRLLTFNGHVVPLSLFNGYGFAVAVRTLWAYDPLVLVFAALGVLALIARAVRHRHGPLPSVTERAASAAWITAAYGVPTFCVYGLYQGSADRIYLPLMPVTCIVAAVGMGWLTKTRLPRPLTGALLGLGVAALTLAATLAGRLRVQADTYTLAADRVQELSAEGDRSVFLTGAVGVPLMTRGSAMQPDALWSGGPWDAYQWIVLREPSRRLSGEASQSRGGAGLPPEALNPAFAKRIVTAPIATRMALFQGDDKALVAGQAISDADADIVLVSTSFSLGKITTRSAAVRDAWMEAVRSDGRWSLDRTITHARGRDRLPVGYRLRFADLWTTLARGPSIEVWVRD